MSFLGWIRVQAIYLIKKVYYEFFLHLLWSSHLRSALVARYFGINSKNVFFGRKIQINFPKRFSVGSYSLINDDFAVLGNEECKIGKYVYTAPRVTVITSSHKPDNMQETSDKVIIGDLCWIGANVTLLPGVHIGEGSIIAAGSVVTKDIEAFSIAAGSPAKVISKREITFPYRLPSGKFYLDENKNVVLHKKELDGHA